MTLNTANTPKKQWVAIAAILTLGVAGGAALLTSRTDAPDNDHGSHAEARGHSDDEHHGQAGKNGQQNHDDDKSHADNEHHGAAAAKGPNGGQLFVEGDLKLEALLSEADGEPRLRLWLNAVDKPATGTLSAVLTRPTGETQTLSFRPEKAGDTPAYVSQEVVEEPHAFDVAITARVGSQTLKATLTKEEGKVELTDAQIQAAGLKLDKASSALIKSAVQLQGEIRLNEDRTSHVVPRVAGVVESVNVTLGQSVKKGQVLAVIASPAASEQRSELQTAQRRLALAQVTHDREKKLWEQKIAAEQDYLQARQAMHEAEVAVVNAQQKLAALGLAPNTVAGGSLNRFELRAPFDGLVIEKHLGLGEAVKEDAQVFTISDLSRVWAEINVPAKDLPQVRVGEKVVVKATAFDATASGTVAFVGALIGEQTRTAKARVVLANPQGAWRPGLFVNVEIVATEAPAAVTVSSAAIQTLGDNKPVVFVKVAGGFLAQPVDLGRSDGQRMEVLHGLRAGTTYAGTGSFVLKSELGKASAEHSH